MNDMHIEWLITIDNNDQTHTDTHTRTCFVMNTTAQDIENKIKSTKQKGNKNQTNKFVVKKK